MKICSLCHKAKPLKDSHLIPKFVGEWIKETSVTGKMRSAETPNKRVQDLVKSRLLCVDCEQIFSKYEKYFSENLFKPFLNSNNPQLQYDIRLKKFIISLLWRVLIDEIKHINWKTSEHVKHATEVESIWRNYLLKNEELKIDYSYLLMLRLVSDAKMIEGTNLDINWYFFRSVDGTVAQSSSEAFVYVKIPGFAFFSSIFNKPLPYFRNCAINDFGKFTFDDQDIEKTIFKFLFERSRFALLPSTDISSKQREAIEKDYLKFSDKVEKSFGFQMYMAKLSKK